MNCTKLEAVARRFCERVERGEVTSTNTYLAFKDALGEPIGPSCQCHHGFLIFANRRPVCSRCGVAWGPLRMEGGGL